MVSHVPLRPDLGAGRIQLELGDELRRLGHHVETFDPVAAFGGTRRTRLDRLTVMRFPARARDYVRRHGKRFDVVDALHGTLPFSKRDLAFNGLLITRTTGLYAFYEAYLRHERATWPAKIPGTAVGKALNRHALRRAYAACRRSFETADLAVVSNADEAAYVRTTLRLGERCAMLPDGLRREHAEALSRAALPAAARVSAREVVFVGAWGLRKGAADWPEIVARTKAAVPAARFRFLGTGVDADLVLRDLGLVPCDWVTVVPRYHPDELPAMLATATVGAFPSYVEGYPASVVEQLAAGIPTVAYDVPGSRALVGPTGLLVTPGDAAAFAAQVAELLALDAPAYARLSDTCSGVTADLRWPAIAEATADTYSKFLARI